MKNLRRHTSGPAATTRPQPRSPGAASLPEVLDALLPSLYRTARVLVRSDAGADDLVQETVLKACRAFDGLRDAAAAKSWLLQILHRTFLNARRGEERRVPVLDLDLDEALALEAIEGTPPLELDENHLSEEVAAALEALPEGFREALWLLDVEELTLAEAASVLDVPVGTVASRAYRARTRLRRLLGARREEVKP